MPPVLSRRRCTRRSRTSPSSSASRQSQNRLPAIRTAISSRCHVRGGPMTSAAKLPGEQWPELQHPSSDRFIGDVQPALGQQIFDIAEAEGKAKIQPHGVPDDVRWELVASKRYPSAILPAKERSATVGVTKPPGGPSFERLSRIALDAALALPQLRRLQRRAWSTWIASFRLRLWVLGSRADRAFFYVTRSCRPRPWRTGERRGPRNRRRPPHRPGG